MSLKSSLDFTGCDKYLKDQQRELEVKKPQQCNSFCDISVENGIKIEKIFKKISPKNKTIKLYANHKKHKTKPAIKATKSLEEEMIQIDWRLYEIEDKFLNTIKTPFELEFLRRCCFNAHMLSYLPKHFVNDRHALFNQWLLRK